MPFWQFDIHKDIQSMSIQLLYISVLHSVSQLSPILSLWAAALWERAVKGCFKYLRKLSTEGLRTEPRTSLTSTTFLFIYIIAWHLFPYHSASYNRGSFRKQPHFPFSGTLFLRAAEKEPLRRGRASVLERCEIGSCHPHSLLMSALSKWDVCRDEMHWRSFISDPWAFTS